MTIHHTSLHQGSALSSPKISGGNQKDLPRRVKDQCQQMWASALEPGSHTEGKDPVPLKRTTAVLSDREDRSSSNNEDK